MGDASTVKPGRPTVTAAKKYVPHYTIDDYRQWEGDWELWGGIPVAMTPSPFGRHQALAARLFVALQNQLSDGGCAAEAVYELDWIVSDDTVVRPDIMVICGSIPAEHLRETPSLVAEVISEATATRDRVYKQDLYEQAGVTCYLLLDPEAETLEVYQRDAAGSWSHQQVTESIGIQICNSCQIHLERAKLFKKT
jgi:Uma2 family endonuclease